VSKNGVVSAALIDLIPEQHRSYGRAVILLDNNSIGKRHR